jgi:hypothetical protein
LLLDGDLVDGEAESAQSREDGLPFRRQSSQGIPRFHPNLYRKLFSDNPHAGFHGPQFGRIELDSEIPDRPDGGAFRLHTGRRRALQCALPVAVRGDCGDKFRDGALILRHSGGGHDRFADYADLHVADFGDGFSTFLGLASRLAAPVMARLRAVLAVGGLFRGWSCRRGMGSGRIFGGP